MKKAGQAPTSGSEDEPPQHADDRKWAHIWTVVQRQPNGSYKEWQELGEVTLPGSERTHGKDLLPWLPLRMFATANEDYGRSYVEFYEGDLSSLNGLTQAVVEGASVAARMTPLVSPTGRVKP